MRVDRIDHVVLTVRDIPATCEFYARVLGMQVITFGEGRKALTFGQQKINLRPAIEEAALIASKPTPGSEDLCFVSEVPLHEVKQHIESCGVKVIEGPVQRNGAVGMMESIYFRDPDGNLIEISNYLNQ
jgi:catechol 2,3-dioxygenase-like lactoylglutathione lyase family enzyme